MVHQETPPPFLSRAAKGQASAFIFAVPHSGRYYPDDLKSRAALSEKALRQSEDAYVDLLFEHVPEQNAALLVATHARAYLDLNRAANELDPNLFTPRLADSDVDVTYRVQAGLGIIPQFVAENTPIYSELLPAREAAKRIGDIHQPYHQRLTSLIDSCKKDHGFTFLVDCHSMPSDNKLPKRGRSNKSPDIILGDCWGTACMRGMTDVAEQLFLSAGFSVRRNVPYSGGYSTAFYGCPEKNIHALQIEINRDLYMDEATLQPLPVFGEIKEKLADITQSFIIIIMERMAHSAQKRLAAE